MNNQEKNTKFSTATRILAVDRVVNQGWRVADSAAAISASRSIVYRWIGRYRQSGAQGLAPRSSRPRCFPRQLETAIVDVIRVLRESGQCLSQIAWQLQLVRSTVWRWLVRLGLNRLPGEPREPVVRFEAQAPGELVHMDIKKLRGFRFAGRKFIEDNGRRWRGAPRQYLHVCVDSRSRYAYASIMDRENAEACISFLEEVIEHFAEQSIQVRRILTDNGSAYRGKAMASATKRLGVQHTFTRIRRPQTNGKAERFIRTAMTEWGYIRYENSVDRDRALPAWLTYYNHQRSHSALGYKPPVSRLVCEQPSET